MADPKDRPGEEAMPELPGSGTPPIEGQGWLWVKVAIWMGVVVVLAAIAWMVSALVA